MNIILEPGALDEVPIAELARFLAKYRVEMVHKPDGLTIRRMAPPIAVAALEKAGREAMAVDQGE